MIAIDEEVARGARTLLSKKEVTQLGLTTPPGGDTPVTLEDARYPEKY